MVLKDSDNDKKNWHNFQTMDSGNNVKMNSENDENQEKRTTKVERKLREG